MVSVMRRRSDVIARDCSLTPPHDGGSVVRIAALFLWMIDLRLHCGRPDVQGFDDVLKEGTSPSIVFDDRTFVSYGITHLGPAVYMGFFVGYLLADTAKSPSFKDMGYVYVVHHAAASLCWTFCACYRVMQSLSCFLQFNELSTPFMNVRQVMLTAGYKSSDLPVTIISLLFFSTFGAVRFFPLTFIIRNWVGRDYSAIQNEVGTGAAMMLSKRDKVNEVRMIQQRRGRNVRRFNNLSCLAFNSVTRLNQNQLLCDTK
eukprot:scaffold4948_cov208-Alexandrium_tamarense.AAC.4